MGIVRDTRKQFALVMADEDGDAVHFLTNEEVQKLMDDPIGEHGVQHFISTLDEVNEYVSRWPEGTAALFKIELVSPEPVTTAWRLP